MVELVGFARRGGVYIVMDTRKEYAPEYRQQTACLVVDTGRAIAEIGRELGVGAGLLGKWVRAERERSADRSRGLDADERAELVRLCKEVAEWKLGNEFLSKAAVFFASK